MAKKKIADVSALSAETLYSEIGRRRAAARTTFGGGPKITCACGKCPKCAKRIAMRKYRANVKIAAHN